MEMMFERCNMEKGMPEIVFFDIETTVPSRVGPGHGDKKRFWVLEFGAMVICPRKLVEIESYCTLIRPLDLTAVPEKPSRSEGISRKAVENVPSFEEVADRVYEMLHGRVWAGHNIQRFDCHRIKEAFADIGRVAPEPVGMIDSLGVLSNKFGKRAGDMKMASLANYFGLGQQKHRSLDDVRMNLEVLKSCATILLLESSVPNTLSDKWKNGSPSISTRSRGIVVDNRRTSPSRSDGRKSPPAATATYQRSVPYATRVTRSSIRKMTDRMRNIWYKAQSTQSLNNLIKHSHSILR